MASVALKRLELGDLDLLATLDAACFAQAWPRSQLADELAHKDALVIGAFVDNQLVGAICARKMLDELSIFRIMTKPEHRRKRVAHALLQAVEAYTQSLTQPLELMLEVSVKNEPAIAFYTREGFEHLAVRKDYYPEGDALVMKRPHKKWQLDYDLLDFGEGYKLERFGEHVLKRPDAEAIGKPQLKSWKYDASCEREGNGYTWTHELAPWTLSRGPIKLDLRLSQSKNVGVFPEQEANWNWLSEVIWNQKRPLKILNLFAYTGAASIVCAQSLADVTHVDSARSTVRWASENAKRSDENLAIRWIVDDAQAFLAKEIRRGKTYDGIILDPPPIGQGQGNRFEFRSDAIELLKACKQVLSKDPAFFLLNAYALNISPSELGKLVRPVIDLPLEVGELGLDTSGERRLSCSVFARFRALASSST